MNPTQIIAVVGPTASGKSACGIEIARAFNGEVISVDSRTVYRGMDIGTAKVREEVRHHGPVHGGVDLVNPDEEYTAAMFQEYARRKIEEIAERGKLPVLVGGTGLWMDAIVDNLSFPNVPPGAKLRGELEHRGLEELAREYLALDPDGADFVDCKNKRRLVRALEVCRATGKPFSALRTKGPVLYDALWLGMSVPREELDARINVRVDKMIEQGLIEEVRRLQDQYGCHIPSMSGIGYRELCEYFDGVVSLEEALENIKTNTRRFARRQMTWFKRREEIVWVKSCGEAISAIRSRRR